MSGHRCRCRNPGETPTRARNGTSGGRFRGQRALTPIRFVYVHGDGGLWRLNRGALEKIAKTGVYFTEAGGKSMKAWHNHMTSQWRHLPGCVDQDEDGRLASGCNGVAVVSYDDLDAGLARYYLNYHKAK